MSAVRRSPQSTANPPAPPVDRLFVYGSLRTGQSARALVEPFVRAWEPATIVGELFDFPSGYPAVVLTPQGGIVMGELLRLADAAQCLAVVDEYEGSDYTRELVQVHHVGGPTWGWVYVLADPRTAALGTPVPGGEWMPPAVSDPRGQPTT